MKSALDVSLETIELGKQALVFCSSKRGAEKQAEDLAKKLQTFDELTNISNEFENVLPNPTKQCKRGAFCIARGVAFHHAGLTSQQRKIIEDSFRKGLIKVICSTPTLAAGLDMPAFRTILKDLKRFTGSWGMQYIPVLEYEQMAGRAGRPGMEDFGEAIAIARTESEKNAIAENYIFGEIEKIQSKLAVEPVLRVHVLSLVSSNFARSKKELLKFFSKTFHAHQFGDSMRLEGVITKVIDMLVDYGFLKTDSKTKDSFFSNANEIGYDKIEATAIGAKVSELYLDPYTANHILQGLEKSKEKFKNIEYDNKIFSLLQLVSDTLEMMPLLRVGKKDSDEMHTVIANYEKYFLISAIEDFAFDEYLNSVKTALFFKAWIEETAEERLLENFNIRPGETRAKIEKIDWLMRCCIELAKSKGYFKLVNDFYKLQVRLKYGVKEELLPLLKLKGIGRVRARKLYNNGIKDLGVVKNRSQNELALIIGNKMSENILSQLGNDNKTL